jgi:ferredoxin/flavodoxin---NADP+ reductase
MSSGQAPPNVGRITYRENLTQDLAIIRMQPTDGSAMPDFKAGQFVALGLKLDGDDKITYRAYSLSSPPEEKRYFEFYIKWATEPVMGKFTSALFKMGDSGELYWRKPAGAFTIEDKKPDGSPETRWLILVASGTGLAPFVSYAVHLQYIGTKRQVVLLHGAKYAKELGYRDLFERMAATNSNFKYLPTVSRPGHPLSQGWRSDIGRVEALLGSQLEKTLGEKVTPENSFFHICGYQGTIDSVVAFLTPRGFVTNRSKRKDGSFDIKIEIYG